MYSFSYLEPACCSMSSSNCCFLTCIQISPEAVKVVWYSHLLKNFPHFVVIHIVKVFGIVNKADVDGLTCSSNSNEPSCNAGDQRSVPGLGSSSGKGNGNPLQYSWLENSMDREAWWATVCGVTKSKTRLSN